MPVYALTAYPKTVSLRDGCQVTVRPICPDDEAGLLALFRSLPAGERHFLKHDVTSPDVVHNFAARRDFDRALALVACAGDAIIGEAVLIRSRHGAYRNVGRIRVVVAEQVRQQGLGTALIRELCDLAQDSELERVNAELVSEVQDDAIRAAEQLGFIRAATIHELLRDEDGRPHDVVVMSLPLGKWYEWWQF